MSSSYYNLLREGERRGEGEGEEWEGERERQRERERERERERVIPMSQQSRPDILNILTGEAKTETLSYGDGTLNPSCLYAGLFKDAICGFTG